MKRLVYFITLLSSFISCDKSVNPEMFDGIMFGEIHEPEIETVDLGLSVKWAKFNLGSSSETDAGSFFAWGEITEKKNYLWSTYVHKNSYGLTKYCLIGNNGIVDNLPKLSLDDDACNVSLGKAWRIPDFADYKELFDGCNWSLTEVKGVRGLLGTSKINNAEIFFPVSGFKEEDTVRNSLNMVCLWSSELNASNDNYARVFVADLNEMEVLLTSVSRYYGLPLRPVFVPD